MQTHCCYNGIMSRLSLVANWIVFLELGCRGLPLSVPAQCADAFTARPVCSLCTEHLSVKMACLIIPNLGPISIGKITGPPKTATYLVRKDIVTTGDCWWCTDSYATSKSVTRADLCKPVYRTCLKLVSIDMPGQQDISMQVHQPPLHSQDLLSFRHLPAPHQHNPVSKACTNRSSTVIREGVTTRLCGWT